jgi:hypothetical protein
MSYEAHDASPRIIGVSVALLVLGVALSLAASFGLYAAKMKVTPNPPPRQTSFTEGAAYQPEVIRDRDQLDATAQHQLHTYAWVDRKAGIAEIPIDRAMALLAAGVKPVPAQKEPGQVP